MLYRVTCPNCGSEVEGPTLGYGLEDGALVFGCEVCVTVRPFTRADRASVVRAASHVLGVAFARGRICTPVENFAAELGALAEEIADRAVNEGVNAGQGNS